MDGSLTADEAEQYDRQIRLWGLDSQKRLRASHVLIVGGRGLGAEVAKNIVLAGVQEVTLMDHTPLETDDSAGRFLMQKNGLNRAEQAVDKLRTLNPNVSMTADTEHLKDKTDKYFCQFDVVVATCSNTEELVRLDEICRANQIKFYCGDVWGYYGYFFTDLGEHEYAMEVAKKESEDDVVTLDAPKSKRAKLESEMITIKETCSFCSLRQAMSTDWSKKTAQYWHRIPPTYFIIRTLQLYRDKEGCDPSPLDKATLDKIREDISLTYSISIDLIPSDLYKWCGSELSPVCAIVGGVLTQEVIKAISARDRPYTNTFLYDGRQTTGIIELLHP